MASVDASLADVVGAPRPELPSRVVGQGIGRDRLVAVIVRSCAGLVVLILGGMLLLLVVGGADAFRAFGAAFIWTEHWNPVTENYGALAAIVGTIASSTIAVVVAAPLALLIAIFLTEMAPAQLRTPVGVAIELLAAVPSIVYGMWGAFTLSPVMASTVQPWLTDKLGGLPVIGKWFFGAPLGYGLFTAGLVLAIMILPFIAASMRDVLLQASPMTKESAYALGATRWDVISKVVVPATRQSLIGAVMLGLGRALGETMAVAFVIGNSNQVPTNIFAPAATIASLIANEFPEAGQGSLKLSALLALGFLLFVIAFTVVAGGRLLIGKQAVR